MNYLKTLDYFLLIAMEILLFIAFFVICFINFSVALLQDFLKNFLVAHEPHQEPEELSTENVPIELNLPMSIVDIKQNSQKEFEMHLKVPSQDGSLKTLSKKFVVKISPFDVETAVESAAEIEAPTEANSEPSEMTAQHDEQLGGKLILHNSSITNSFVSLHSNATMDCMKIMAQQSTTTQESQIDTLKRRINVVSSQLETLTTLLPSIRDQHRSQDIMCNILYESDDAQNRNTIYQREFVNLRNLNSSCSVRSRISYTDRNSGEFVQLDKMFTLEIAQGANEISEERLTQENFTEENLKSPKGAILIGEELNRGDFEKMYNNENLLCDVTQKSGAHEVKISRIEDEGMMEDFEIEQFLSNVPTIERKLKLTIRDVLHGRIVNKQISYKVTKSNGTQKLEHKFFSFKVKPGTLAGARWTFQQKLPCPDGRRADVEFVATDADHPYFRRDGANILHQALITQFEAQNGLFLDLNEYSSFGKEYSGPIEDSQVEVYKHFGLPIVNDPNRKGNFQVQFKIVNDHFKDPPIERIVRFPLRNITEEYFKHETHSKAYVNLHGIKRFTEKSFCLTIKPGIKHGERFVFPREGNKANPMRIPSDLIFVIQDDGESGEIESLKDVPLCDEQPIEHNLLPYNVSPHNPFIDVVENERMQCRAPEDSSKNESTQEFSDEEEELMEDLDEESDEESDNELDDELDDEVDEELTDDDEHSNFPLFEESDNESLEINQLNQFLDTKLEPFAKPSLYGTSIRRRRPVPHQKPQLLTLQRNSADKKSAETVDSSNKKQVLQEIYQLEQIQDSFQNYEPICLVDEHKGQDEEKFVKSFPIELPKVLSTPQSFVKYEIEKESTINGLKLTLEDILKGCKRSFGYLVNENGVKVEKNFGIDIHPGAVAGTKFKKCSKEGEPLEFIIEEIKHKRFTRKGLDLYMWKQIPLRKALRGGLIVIETLDKCLYEVRFPQLPLHNYQHLIPNYGLPDIRNPGSRGNLVVIFQIVYPTKLTKNDKQKVSKIFAPFFQSNSGTRDKIKIWATSSLQAEQFFNIGHNNDRTSIIHVLELSLEQILYGYTGTFQIQRKIIDSSGTELKEIKTLAINLKPGQTEVFFKGEGNHLPGSIVPSDVLLVVNTKPHPIFRKLSQVDLQCTIVITLEEALCGCKLRVPTLDKELDLFFGSGENRSTILKVKPVKGYGLPYPDNPRKRGNLFVNFEIIFPAELNKTQKRKVSKVLSKYSKSKYNSTV